MHKEGNKAFRRDNKDIHRDHHLDSHKDNHLGSHRGHPGFHRDHKAMVAVLTRMAVVDLTHMATAAAVMMTHMEDTSLRTRES